jgi:hypothetical protein
MSIFEKSMPMVMASRIWGIKSWFLFSCFEYPKRNFWCSLQISGGKNVPVDGLGIREWCREIEGKTSFWISPRRGIWQTNQSFLEKIKEFERRPATEKRHVFSVVSRHLRGAEAK